MVDLNGAGSTTFGGLQATAAGQVWRWTPELITPFDKTTVPITAPSLVTRQTSWDGNSASVQVQVSTASTFATTVHDSTVVQASGASVGRIVTALADGTTYYWRARAGNGTDWSGWTATRSFKVSLVAGDVAETVTMNVGFLMTADRDATETVLMNVGVEITVVDNWPVYNYENVGVEVTTVDNWPVYSYENVDGTLYPTPVIWFLKPASGRAGDGFQIFGFGVGDLQATYAGEIQLDYGGSTGWVTVPVVSWQTFPASPDAYTEDRVLDPALGIVDPQHSVIEVVVPDNALPPGYPVRVRTVTP